MEGKPARLLPTRSTVNEETFCIFSGDAYGYLNAVINELGFTTKAVQWLTDANYLLGCVIVVQLWVSMGVVLMEPMKTSSSRNMV